MCKHCGGVRTIGDRHTQRMVGCAPDDIYNDVQVTVETVSTSVVRVLLNGSEISPVKCPRKVSK